MLHYQTVTPQLKKCLQEIMSEEIFSPFRLAGGTALSLQIGHRKSIDIDLFTDQIYGSIDFYPIDRYFEKKFKHCYHDKSLIVGFGKTYFIGQEKNELLKIDVFYSDTFIEEAIELENIRLATENEILSMKLDVIQRIGRKKDFWDIHEYLDKLDLKQLLNLHKKRYPYTHNSELINSNLINFKNADLDLDPICLKGKYWDIIKLDFYDFITRL